MTPDQFFACWNRGHDCHYDVVAGHERLAYSCNTCEAQMNDDKMFWMVLGKSTPIVRHASYELARAEAIRLAKANPNCDFFVLQGITRVRQNPPKPASLDVNPLRGGW